MILEFESYFYYVLPMAIGNLGVGLIRLYALFFSAFDTDLFLSYPFVFAFAAYNVYMYNYQV